MTAFSGRPANSKRRNKWFIRVPLAALAIAVIAILAGLLYLRGSLPQLAGRAAMDGLTKPVDIVRDANAIPHIFASTAHDAYYALGVVHAQDRLWQLEMNRRIGSGRLAEIFGPAALDQDKFLRTLGISRTAEAIYRNLDSQTQARLQAYAAGINGFLANRHGPLPVEFLLIGAEPGPWRPQDSVAWQLMMAWDLSGNWTQELLRLRLSKKLSSAQIEEFLPPYPGDTPQKLPDLKQLYAGIDLNDASLAYAAPSALPEGAGSNNWVIDGSRTQSGKPLLANDPHLGLSAPSIWYFAHLDAPDLTAIGATLPGIPAIILGRNARIAWGFTNTGPDTQDLFLEKIAAADPASYVTPEATLPFTVVEERIKVKGAADLLLKVRATRHGPVISDAIRAGMVPDNYVLAFAWTALEPDDRTIASGDALSRAGNWPEFVAAARDFHAPQQNMVYADVDGNIGFIAPGRIPVRKPANDLHGLAPAPGWDARYDWVGFIPFEQLPQRFNPVGGSIVTANHKIVGADYPWFITAEWAPPYRADRITSLIDATPKHSVDSFRAIQADTVSLVAEGLLPYLRKAKPADARITQLLEQWNGDMRGDDYAPLLFNAWLREFTRLIYADELGDLFASAWDQRAVFVRNVLDNRDGAARWCDNVATLVVENCATQVALALDLAVQDLDKRCGFFKHACRWGELHHARSAHRPFSGKPLLGALFDITVPTPGSTYTINVGRNRISDEKEPFANQHAASFRAIYDLANPDRSLFIHSTGQSGNRLSRWYDNFALPWAKVEYLPMTMQRSAIEKDAIGKLVLTPAK